MFENIHRYINVYHSTKDGTADGLLSTINSYMFRIIFCSYMIQLNDCNAFLYGLFPSSLGRFIQASGFFINMRMFYLSKKLPDGLLVASQWLIVCSTSHLYVYIYVCGLSVDHFTFGQSGPICQMLTVHGMGGFILGYAKVWACSWSILVNNRMYLTTPTSKYFMFWIVHTWLLCHVLQIMMFRSVHWGK